MKTLVRPLAFVLCLFGFHSQASDLSKLEFITEAYPPYNFQMAGNLRGIAVDLLVAASAKTGSSVKRSDISLQPWARGYRSALNQSNICLFSTTRTDERESLFKWAGPIAKTRIVVMTRKESNININSASDLTKLKLGAIRDDVGQQLLIANGVAEGQIELSAKAEAMIEKLKYRRIDGIAYEENVARWFIRKNDLSNDDFEVSHVLKEGELYYAFSKDTDDAFVETLQKGIDAIKSTPGKLGDSLYDDIVRDYL